MTHHLKTWPEFYQAVEEGRKTFEIRRNDRPYAVGDVLHLGEFEPCPECGGSGVNLKGEECRKGYYTGRHLSADVLYLTDFGQVGNVVMAITKNKHPA